MKIITGIIDFFTGGSLKMWLLIGAFTALAAIIGLAYWHYDSLLDENATLKTNNAILFNSVETQHNTINKFESANKEWKAEVEKTRALMEELNKGRREASADAGRLTDALSANDPENVLARENPQELERRLNDGTANALRMFRDATTGSENDNGGNRAPGR